MMKDLLAYFEQANAAEGPAQWNLVLGEGQEQLQINLDHFRKWIAKSDRRRRSNRTVPALDSKVLWKIREPFLLLADPERNPFVPEPKQKDPDFEIWLSSYPQRYDPLPGLVWRALNETGPISDIAALVLEIYSAIMAIARTSDQLRRRGEENQARGGDASYWSPQHLWQLADNQWVRFRLYDLGAWEEAGT